MTRSSSHSRFRSWLTPTFALAIAATGVSAATDIGSRRELFVETSLIESVSGEAQLRLHQPQPQEISIVHDEPWEGAGSGYHSVFQDGDLYRMYYKAWQRWIGPDEPNTDSNPLLTAYAESDDGIHWRKPALGLHEIAGTKANNIVLVSGIVGAVDADAGHPAFFKDDNPDATPDARYKAILRSRDPRGLLAFKSADAIHWEPMADEPVITDGAFDSQNLAFWDAAKGEYRAYWRFFHDGDPYVHRDMNPIGTRAIRTAVSQDFIHWEKQEDLVYVDSPEEALYTNAIKPYHRAPHILMGFPMRYVDRGWSDNMRELPNPEHREWRASRATRLGTALTDSLFMASRDGVTFKRWNEAFLRPGMERDGTWSYGQQEIAWHMVETKSPIAGAPNDLSFYVTEFYWTGAKGSAIRRYTLRLDGFVSLHAPLAGGELTTKSVTFSGSELVLNYSTSAAGTVWVELQDANGEPIPGFTLEDCEPLFGDTIERRVTWGEGADLSTLAGKAVRLRFVVEDADLYAYQFK
ncbi:hypothetical protein [Actomonas aquatica]|uniref:Glycosyl hydrolase family 32 N-terminal domain-containing protein n=1 Tax=Actomonas aquatica TaxID=2866162 RepID=A0ABZ1CF70_9BACT|nr:hypothetical protein [Opitutus sp. WL0086]WRQ90106.1 hypothetical protein K1X11_011860 [Opitutus sp. WL0086]